MYHFSTLFALLFVLRNASCLGIYEEVSPTVRPRRMGFVTKVMEFILLPIKKFIRLRLEGQFLGTYITTVPVRSINWGNLCTCFRRW